VRGAQRDAYNATGKATRTAEEDFMDAFAGGALCSAHRCSALTCIFVSPTASVCAGMLWHNGCAARVVPTKCTAGTYGKAAAKSVEEKENLAVQLALRAEPKGADSHTSGFEVAPAALHTVDQPRSAAHPCLSRCIILCACSSVYIRAARHSTSLLLARVLQRMVGCRIWGSTETPASAGVDAQPRRVRHNGHHRGEHGGAVRRDAGHLRGRGAAPHQRARGERLCEATSS